MALPPRRTASDAVCRLVSWRGGPKTLYDLHLDYLTIKENYVVLNKAADSRLDGDFDATIEKAVRSFMRSIDVQLYRDHPTIEKFRWIHQLDFGTLTHAMTLIS